MSVARITEAPAVPWDGRPHPSTAQHAFWRHVFGDETGLIAAFSGKREPGEQALRDETSRYFEWPSQAPAASAWLAGESNHGRDAYACAHLVTKRRRVKPNAARMWALYVDGDGAEVPSTLPRPTLVVESSPGREQAYWRLTRSIDPAVGEQLNKRLAKAIGADMSGWDLTQLLRPPGTRNWKYAGGPEVRIVSLEDRAYDPDELDRILPSLPAEPERPTVRLEAGTAALRDDDQARLEKMFRGPRGAELRDLANGGSKHRKPNGEPDHSADDLSLMNALAFWLDKDPGRMATAFRSFNRYRPKLDKVHAADGRTYLEMTIGEALDGCRESYSDLVSRRPGPSPVPSQPAVDDPAAPDDVDALRAEVLRLRRALLDRDDKVDELAQVIQVQQTVILAERDRLETLEPIITAIDEVLARPDDELSSDDKVVDIALARWLPFYRSKRAANGEPETASLGYLAKVVGMPARRVSKSLDRQSSEDPNTGAPFRKVVTRKPKVDVDGQPVIDPRTNRQAWESSLEVAPWHDSPAATLRAAATYATPARPKRGGSKAASDARWGRCERHRDDAVVLKGFCTKCDALLGVGRVSAEDFERLNVQLEHSDHPPATVDAPLLVDVQVGHSDGARGDRERLNLHPVHSAPRIEPNALAARRAVAAVAIPTRSPDPSRQPALNGHGDSLGRIALTRENGHAPPKPSAWKHACGSLERGPRSDGTIVCDGCAEPVGTVRELAPGVVETVRTGATGAVETIIGRDASLPAVDKDVTGYRPCCGTDGILRQRGGVWTCADCRAEVTA